MHRLATAAQQRELYILNYLYTYPGSNPTMQSVWAKNFRTPQFQELCNDSQFSFDWIIITLLDLQAAGLIKLQKGWKLTEQGEALVSIYKQRGNRKLIYLASPCTTNDPDTKQRWLSEAQQAIDYCFATQPHLFVFSPVLYTVPIEARGVTLSVGSDWVSIDLNALEKVDEMWVLMSEGYEHSEGIKREIQFAETHGTPIHHKRLDDILSIPHIPF